MDELTCFCFTVEKHRVIAAIENGCRTVQEVRDRTGATAGCGGCRPDVEALLDFYARFPRKPGAAILGGLEAKANKRPPGGGGA
jgi:NAD(P)H-nitrite reductase large subunit